MRTRIGQRLFKGISGCLLVSSLNSSLAMAQNGYNTSGGQSNGGSVAPGPNGANNTNRNNTSSQNSGIVPPGGTGNSVPTQQALNPGLNPNLPGNSSGNVPGRNMPPSGASKEVVTADPYAELPISKQEQEYIDQLLKYWESNTRDIERMSCEFVLYEYNSEANFVRDLATKSGKDVRGIKNTVSSGVLKYMKPDKGMYRIDHVYSLTGNIDKNNNPEMKEFDNVFGDYWICDGATVHNYDRSVTTVTHYVIPENLRGLGILESPMPFLFGVDAVKIKERYWIRALQPPMGQNGKPREDIFLIEAYPKMQQDAVNYSKVHIFLDRKEFLPIGMIKYNPEHIDQDKMALVDSRSVYEFKTREKNASVFAKMSEMIWNREFIPIKLPDGWKEETKAYDPDPASQYQASMFQSNGAAQGANGTTVPGGLNQPNGILGSGAGKPNNGNQSNQGAPKQGSSSTNSASRPNNGLIPK